eukprot:357240-Chlamydomonas_euryale.AAC.6
MVRPVPHNPPFPLGRPYARQYGTHGRYGAQRAGWVEAPSGWRAAHSVYQAARWTSQVMRHKLHCLQTTQESARHRPDATCCGQYGDRLVIHRYSRPVFHKGS